MADPNMNDSNVNGQNGDGATSGRPEYGAYAPQGQSNGQYGGSQGQAGGQYRPNEGGPYAGGQPYGQPFAYQQYQQYQQYGQPNGQQYGQGGWQPAGAFALIEELLPQRAKNAVRGLYGVVGVAAVVLGLALLFWPGKTLTVFAVALGVYFVVSGVIRIVSALVTIGLPGGWRLLDVLVGILLAFGGVVMLKNAALSGTSLAVFVTLIVGFGWIMEGVMALAESWRLPKSGWAVCYAIISIVAGVVLLLSPVSSMMFLVVFGGCALVVMGVSAIVRAFTFGRRQG